MMEEELDAVLSRPRYGGLCRPRARRPAAQREDRPSSWPPLAHPSGTFGLVEVAMPRRPIERCGRWYDRVEEQGTEGLPAPHIAADAVIAANLSGRPNTRRVAGR